MVRLRKRVVETMKINVSTLQRDIDEGMCGVANRPAASPAMTSGRGRRAAPMPRDLPRQRNRSPADPLQSTQRERGARHGAGVHADASQRPAENAD
jgi:hypothetical protein